MLKWDIKVDNINCPSREKLIRNKSQEVYICNAKHQKNSLCLCLLDDCPNALHSQIGGE